LIVCGRSDALKQLPQVTPAGQRRYELVVDAPTVALSRLRRARGVADATLFGSAIHVLADAAVDCAYGPRRQGQKAVDADEPFG